MSPCGSEILLARTAGSRARPGRLAWRARVACGETARSWGMWVARHGGFVVGANAVGLGGRLGVGTDGRAGGGARRAPLKFQGYEVGAVGGGRRRESLRGLRRGCPRARP